MNIGKVIAATGLVLAFAAGAADVEVLGNYTKPHTATKGETVNLNMKPGAILGGGWRKAVLTVEDGGRLALSGDDGKLETVVVDVKQGGVFVDGLSVHRGNANRGADSYRITASGRVEFPFGVKYVAAAWGKSHPILELKPTGEVVIGDDIDESDKAVMAWKLGGGKVRVENDAAFYVSKLVFLKDTETEVDVAAGKVCDMSGAEFEPGAKIVKTGRGKLLLTVKPENQTVREGRIEIVAKKPFRPVFKVLYDTCNRNYRIDASAITNHVTEITYVYPDEDAPKGVSELTTSAPRIRRRFPSKTRGPFVVKAKMKTTQGGVMETDIKVTPVPEEKMFHPPAPVDKIIFGPCAYGKEYNLVDDMIARNWGNLYAIYGDWGAKLTKKWFGPERSEKLDGMDMHFMTIYGGAREGLVKQLHDDWGGRYLENNVGEYCGYLYQGLEASPLKNRRMTSMTAARDWMVEQWIFSHFFTSWGRYGYHHLYSTSGSPLAHYELQGGLEVICNELWACGAGNLGYTTAEARGAARKWKPEYWSGWNAHDWQTKGIPYGVDQKYDSLYAGLLIQYVMGTPLIVLESGAQTAQAWQTTVPDKGRKREQQAFDGHAPTHYRDTLRKFWEFVQANPRDKGTPETRFAIALGNTDGFVGVAGGWLAVWGNHREAISNSLWRCGAPEYTFREIECRFYPTGKKAIAPYANCWLSGSPYGQCDVVGVDDESRYADVSRYDYLVFGGWNLMTPTAIRTLDKFTANGGTLLIANPQFSTRDDREYANYTVKDMIQPKLAGLVVSGRTTVTGAVEVAKNAPAFVGKAFGKLEAFDKGVDLAKVRLAPGAETMASVAGLPLLVRARAGKGWVWYWAGWQYPGYDKVVKEVYADIAAGISTLVKQRVTIESVTPDTEDDDTLYCNFAAYGKKAYFANLDTLGKRTVRAKFADGTLKVLEMAPCSVTTVELPKKLHR